MDYTEIPAQIIVEKTRTALKEHNINSLVVANGAEALEKIKELIPAGSSVMNGSSTTLNQIGYIDLLKSGQHQWNNVHERIVNETDPEKQKQLRKQALLSDYYLGSVHALTEAGELVIASNTGSQLPHLAYSSQNVLLVVSTNKITPDLPTAMNRLQEFVMPLEDQRMMTAYGKHTNRSKTLIINNEAESNHRDFTIILVNERLGF